VDAKGNMVVRERYQRNVDTTVDAARLEEACATSGIFEG
jgi:hypothetical protein